MTIAEIAQLAGVSIGTVDRVLHDRGRISPSTRDKVLKIIQDNDYRPNPMARQLKLNRPHVLGVLLPVLQSEGGYWRLLYKGVEKAAGELSAFSLQVVLREFDRATAGSFTKEALVLMERGIDGLLVAPVIPDEAIGLLRLRTDIPYAFVDSPLPDLHPIAILAQDPAKSGRIAARLMHLLAPPPATYISIQTYGDAYHSNERVRAFHEYFKEYSEVTLGKEECRAIEDPMAVEALLERISLNYGAISGFFVANDAVCHLAKVLERLHGDDRPALIGFDLIGENREMLKSGRIDCLLSQHPEIQGYEATYRLFRHVVLHEASTKSPEIPIDIFFKENLVDDGN
jgi:LacI family transcriptional regulator